MQSTISILFPSRARCVTRCRLFAWLQKDMRWCVARFNVCDADFDHIAALHGARPRTHGCAPKARKTSLPVGTGALFHTLGHMAPLVRFPAEFAQRVCPDDASNVYECRHGIGHGVLYAVWLQRPELAGRVHSLCVVLTSSAQRNHGCHAHPPLHLLRRGWRARLDGAWTERKSCASSGYSVRHQPRPYGLERATEEERRAVDAMCEQADGIASSQYRPLLLRVQPPSSRAGRCCIVIGGRSAIRALLDC